MAVLHPHARPLATSGERTKKWLGQTMMREWYVGGRRSRSRPANNHNHIQSLESLIPQSRCVDDSSNVARQTLRGLLASKSNHHVYVHVHLISPPIPSRHDGSAPTSGKVTPSFVRQEAKQVSESPSTAAIPSHPSLHPMPYMYPASFRHGLPPCILY